MSKAIKKRLPILIKIAICFQLGFTPYYGYSTGNDDKNSTEQHRDRPQNTEGRALTVPKEMPVEVEESLKAVLQDQSEELIREGEAHPELNIKNKIETLNSAASALEMGTFEEFLNQHPEIKTEAQNIFLFANQTVETIEQYFDHQTRTVVSKVSARVKLSDYDTHPVPVLFNDVQVRYDKHNKELLFEGISTKVIKGKKKDWVVVRHRVPDMEIVDYANDGELLVLVDAKKGLLLVNMFFARGFLSKTPIPFTQVRSPVLSNLRQQAEVDDFKGKVTVELYKDGVLAPDTFPEFVDNLQKAFDGRAFITQGDLMVSYLDSENNKHLVQFLKRTEIAARLKMDYSVLDMMIKMVAPYLMDTEQIKRFAEEKQEMVKRSDTVLAEYTLSSIFARGSIDKLIQAKDSIRYIINEHLADLQNEKNTSNREMAVFKEIKRNLQTTLEQMQEQDLGNIEEEKPKAKKTMDVFTRNKAIRLIAGIQRSIFRPVGSFFSDNKIELITGAILAVPALYLMADRLLYNDEFVFYTGSILPHLLAVGAFLPVTLIVSALYSVDIAKKIHGVLPLNRLQKFIDKWEGTTWKHRMVGFGVKFVGYGMLGFWVRLTRWMGQPHFFTAIQKKLNPLQKISPHSDIGKAMGLTQATRVGVAPKPQWNRNSRAFARHQHLQTVVAEKELRIEFIAWLMATLAALQEGKVKEGAQLGVSEVLVHGIGVFDLKELIKTRQDSVLQMEILWVMKHLQKEIKQLNNINIHKELTNLDMEVLKQYYKTAKEKIHQLRSEPSLTHKLRRATYTSAKAIQATPLRNFGIRNLLTHNMSEVEILSRVPTDFVADRVSVEFLMDHLVVVLMPLIATERADLFLENFTRDMSIYANKALFTGEAHIQDVWLNIVAHFFIVAGQRSLQFANNPSMVKNIAEGQSNIYPSSAKTHYPLPANKMSIFEEIKNLFVYFGMTGKPDKSVGYPDNFSNLGKTLWIEYKTRVKTWQIGAILILSLRYLLTDQSLSEMFFAYLLLNLTAGALNIVWVLLARGAQIGDVAVQNNKRKIERLINTLYRVKRQLYESKEVWQNDYREAVLEIRELYYKKGQENKLLSVVEPVAPELLTYLKNPNQTSAFYSDKAQEVSEELLQLLSTSSPLPTEPNQFARRILVFLLGGILGTAIAVELIVLSFDPNYLNWGAIGALAGLVFSIYTALFWSYEKLFDWKSAKLPRFFRNWKTHFSENIVRARKGLHNTCQRTFNRSSK